MLFVSLILSALLLMAANGTVWRGRNPGTTIVGCSLLFGIGPFFLMCVLPAVTLQALLLCVSVIVWRASHRGPSFFLALSCGATLIAYGVSGMAALETERQYARLRLRYPYESMEDRLAVPKPVSNRAPLSAATALGLARMEREIGDHPNGLREFHLKLLHEQAVTLFINSPGFGIARMGNPTEQSLAGWVRREEVPLQPGSGISSPWSPGDSKRPPRDEEDPLSLMHDESIVDFVNPRGFGYFKDRSHVAGFETHRFSRVPDSKNRWKVQSLELVSLLLHDEPEVYVSDHLPRMDRLHRVSTRPPDRFERFGLDALRQGEDIFISQVEEGVRMLGGVRSVSQCLACHGGERGDLLGAFSYTLRSDGP
jgi:hypothetical protein